jgi:hypothetical protein
MQALKGLVISYEQERFKVYFYASSKLAKETPSKCNWLLTNSVSYDINGEELCNNGPGSPYST